MSLKVLERRSFSQQQRKASDDCHVSSNNNERITNNNNQYHKQVVLQEINKRQHLYNMSSNGPIEQIETAEASSKKIMTVSFYYYTFIVF